MPNLRRLLVTGAAVTLAGLIAMLPARVAHRWLSPADVQLAGIDGSVWNGGAAEALIGGVYLRELRWSLRPFKLLTGRLGYRLQAEPAGGFLESDFAITVGGSLAVDSLRAAVPLAVFSATLPLDDISGQVTLRLEDVLVEDGWPSRLSGQAGVARLLVLPLAPEPLGDFRAEFQTADGTIVGSVEDLAGMLDVAATLTLKPDKSYALIGQVGTTADASQSVVQQLKFLGTPDDRGLREFRLEGSL